jgi:hypothetical protein
VAGEIDPLRVVNDAIENGVSADCRSPTVAFFEYFEEVVAGGGIEWRKTPIIEDEQLHTTERPQEAGITAIAAREREVGEQLGKALVENGSIVAAGFVAESRCQPTFADSGWSRAAGPCLRSSRLRKVCAT